MLSKDQLLNIAASLLSYDSDATQVKNWLEQYLPETLDRVSREHNWNFLQKEQVISVKRKVSTDVYFQLPNDLLKINAVHPVYDNSTQDPDRTGPNFVPDYYSQQITQYTIINGDELRIKIDNLYSQEKINLSYKGKLKIGVSSPGISSSFQNLIAYELALRGVNKWDKSANSARALRQELEEVRRQAYGDDSDRQAPQSITWDSEFTRPAIGVPIVETFSVSPIENYR